MKHLDASLKASIESFFYKGPSPLYTELTGILADIQAGDLEARERLTAVLRKRTGLSKLTTIIDEHLGVNAYIVFPQANVNHVLRGGWGFNWNAFAGAAVNYGDYATLIKQTSGATERNGSVSGIFASFPVSITIGRGLFDAQFTPAEIAAVVLHEVGHIYGYFQTLCMTVVSSLLVNQTVKALQATTDLHERVQIVDRTVKFLDLRDVDSAGVAAEGEEGTAETVLIRSVVLKLSSDQGAEKLFSGEAEFVADSYATHSGAAQPLASALVKIFKAGGHLELSSRSNYVIVECLKVAYLLIGVAVPGLAPMVALIAGMMIGLSKNAMLYRATPTERMEEVHADLVNLLKDRSLPAELREALVQDTKFVSGIRETFVERHTLVTMLWLTLSPSRRKLYKQQQFQRDLGKLINNDLYTRASELTLLKGR